MTRQQAHIKPVAVAVAVSATVLEAAAGTTRRAATAIHPIARIMLRPPWLPKRLHPEVWMETLNREGEAHSAALRRELSRRLDELVPVVLTEVVRRAHVTDLILRYVDLDRVVSAVDLDAAAARLDVAAVVEQVEVDPIVARVDIDAVIDRVDIDAVVARVDLDAVIEKLDLTSVVLQRVELDVLIQAVLDRMDLVGLAEEVIDGVDLPEIIRESTGSMASETVRGARMQGIVADEAVGRAVDRLLLRHRHRSTQAPTAPDEPSSSQGSSPGQRDRPN